MKRYIECGVLVALVITWIAMIPSKTMAIQGNASRDIWAQFSDVNRHDGWLLGKCESQLQNVSRPDSNGRLSDGIWQYNRGPGNSIASGTWGDFSRRSGITGSPLDPIAAAKMTNWAIDAGLLGHWTCAHILRLVN